MVEQVGYIELQDVRTKNSLRKVSSERLFLFWEK